MEYAGPERRKMARRKRDVAAEALFLSRLTLGLVVFTTCCVVGIALFAFERADNRVRKSQNCIVAHITLHRFDASHTFVDLAKVHGFEYSLERQPKPEELEIARDTIVSDCLDVIAERRNGAK